MLLVDFLSCLVLLPFKLLWFIVYVLLTPFRWAQYILWTSLSSSHWGVKYVTVVAAIYISVKWFRLYLNNSSKQTARRRSYGTATNGTATNGTATNGTATNGTATNGTATNGTATIKSSSYAHYPGAAHRRIAGVSQNTFTRCSNEDSKVGINIAVVVVGDVGRSPRMQNHSAQCAKWIAGTGNTPATNNSTGVVYLVGYNDTAVRVDVSGCVEVVPLSSASQLRGWRQTLLQFGGPIGYVLFGAARFVAVAADLFLTLYRLPALGHIILQVPPSLPSLIVCKAASYYHNSKLIIDWHNYGYTLLPIASCVQPHCSTSGSTAAASSTVGTSSMFSNSIIMLFEFVEFTVARISTDLHICVSNAMKMDLSSRGIRNAVVLYDKPPSAFRVLNGEQRRILRYRTLLSSSSTATTISSGSTTTATTISSGSTTTATTISSSNRRISSDSTTPVTATADSDIVNNISDSTNTTTGSCSSYTAIAAANGSSNHCSCDESAMGLQKDLQWVAGCIDIIPLLLSADASSNIHREQQSVLGSIIGLSADINNSTERGTDQQSNNDFESIYCRMSECVSTTGTSCKRRPVAVCVASTSWTVDEDMYVLLAALVEYDKQALSNEQLPNLWLIVTGKGAERSKWVQVASGTAFSKIAFSTVFVHSDDYPLVLGFADLGICMHKSSSGLDLPMKIVDMYGVGLPNVAYSYNALQEMRESGMVCDVFDSAETLCNVLVDYLHLYPLLDCKLVKAHREMRQRRLRDVFSATGSGVVRNGQQLSVIPSWSCSWSELVVPLL